MNREELQEKLDSFRCAIVSEEVDNEDGNDSVRIENEILDGFRFWIPVSEGMPVIPDNNSAVDVFFRVEDSIYFGWFEYGETTDIQRWGTGFYDYHDYVWRKDITHYAYIPEVEE